MNKKYENLDTNISRIERTLQKIKEKEMTSLNLKGSCVRILMIIDESNEELTASKLSKISGFDKAHISRILKDLYDRNLIAYTGKKYAAKILLTDEGNKVVTFIKGKIEFYVDKAGKNLKEEDRQIFYRVLALIADNLEKIYGEEK